MVSRAEKQRRHRHAQKIKQARGKEAVTTAQTIGIVTAANEHTPSPVRKKRMTGIEWLLTRNPPRLKPEQVAISKRYAAICGEALRAEMPSRAGSGGGYGSKTPGQQVFSAVSAKVQADGLLRGPVDPDTGRALIWLMEAVCYHGETLRDLAAEQVRQEALGSGLTEAPAAAVNHRAITLEERLKVGLALLRPLMGDQFCHQRQEVAA